MSRWPCKDYLKGTCNNSSCKRWHPPECLFYKNKNGCRFGEKCSFAHRQVDAQPTKWSKSNNDKSAAASLKKGDWHERGPVTDQAHDQGDLIREVIIQRTTIGLRISGHEAAEVYSPEEHRHAEINPTCEIHKGYRTSH